ncbi:unnamed protein product [Calypogeia fissa]
MAQKEVFRTMESALFADPYRVITYPDWDRADRVLVPTAVFARERESRHLLALERPGVQFVDNLPAQITTTMVNLGAERNDGWKKTQKEIDESIATYLKELDHSSVDSPGSHLNRGLNLVDKTSMSAYMESNGDQSASSSSRSRGATQLEPKFNLYPESDIHIDFREESKAWAGLRAKAMNSHESQQLGGEGVSGQGRGNFHCHISNVRRVSADSRWMGHVLRDIWKPDPQQFQLPQLFDVKAMQLWIVTEVLLAEEMTITADSVNNDPLTTYATKKNETTVLKYGKKGFSFPFAFRAVIASFNSMTGEFVQGSLRNTVFGTPPLKHLMAAEWDVDEFEWDLDAETLTDHMVAFANAVNCEFFEIVNVEPDSTMDARPWLWLGVTSLTLISAYHTLSILHKRKRPHRLL